MRSIIAWLRSLLALVAGVFAIDLVHRLATAVFPRLYEGALALDGDRVGLLCIVFIAGVFGSMVMALVAGRRVWLHLGVFLVVTGALDILAVAYEFAGQPLWFKALVLLTLPFQLWAGGLLALWVQRRLGWSVRGSGTAAA